LYLKSKSSNAINISRGKIVSPNRMHSGCAARVRLRDLKKSYVSPRLGARKYSHYQHERLASNEKTSDVAAADILKLTETFEKTSPSKFFKRSES